MDKFFQAGGGVAVVWFHKLVKGRGESVLFFFFVGPTHFQNFTKMPLGEKPILIGNIINPNG